MKVAFCASEIFPYAKTGGLADVCGALPLELENIGVEVSLFLPRYRCIDANEFKIEKISEHLSKTILGRNVQVYFIEKPSYFDREGLYGDSHGDYTDNLERFQYFCAQVLIVLKQLNLRLDILHCHDWQTALIPVYMKEKYHNDEFFAQTKTVLTIHNLAYQGLFPKEAYDKLNLPHELFSQEGFEFYDKVSLLKAGIIYCDEVTTVSKQYSHEIQTKKFGCGLDEVLHTRENKLFGILNGLDYDVWNPSTDSLIERNYTVENFVEAKAVNKRCLQERLHLPVQDDIPVFGFVGRLSHQKGVDIILEVIDAIAHMELQIVIQGVGEQKYCRKLSKVAKENSQRMAVCFEFDEPLAHQIYAGCDFFLMPSRFEPCGLSQMISLAYGSIPIVFRTGGLADTVQEFDGVEGNGFVFQEYKKKYFIDAIEKAADIFHQEGTFRQLIKNAFHSRFPWDKSAWEYVETYQKCLI